MLTSSPGLTSFTTIFGATVSGTILSSDASTPTLHNWTADSTGLYQTSTDLGAEWKSYYQQMLAGHGASLTDVQRLEGNAEAVFENTALKGLDAADLTRDREDAQREYDAIAAAIKLAGIDGTKPLTQQGYLLIDQTIQGNATLDELFMQGHGLNNSGVSRYAGYTNDFQNGVDKTTRFVGGGIDDNGENALTDFFDDVTLSHIGFSVVWQNGQLTQLNQNGANEDPLLTCVVALNDAMYYRVYTSADFASHAPTAATNQATNAAFYTAQDQRLLAALKDAAAAPASAGHIKTIYGFEANSTISFNAGNGITHVWTADANGEYQTTSNLAAEWRNAYVTLLTVGAKGLTVEQRVEADAEAFFENTGLSKLSAAQQAVDRADAQRQFDAEFMAMQKLGIDPSATLTQANYLAVSHLLGADPTLNELSLQGHGLNNPPSARYDGFTNDFQTGVDATTTITGVPGLNGKEALADAFDDLTLGHSPFAVVVVNGTLRQLNQDGKIEESLANALKLQNYVMHTAALQAANFKA